MFRDLFSRENYNPFHNFDMVSVDKFAYVRLWASYLYRNDFPSRGFPCAFLEVCE